MRYKLMKHGHHANYFDKVVHMLILWGKEGLKINGKLFFKI